MTSAEGGEAADVARRAPVSGVLAPRFGGLSPRQADVLKWAMAGKTNWEISQILGIEPRTVKFHITKVMARLGAASRTQAVALALRDGLVRDDRNSDDCVHAVSAADVEDVLLIRGAIEGRTAALVAERRLDLAPLRRALAAFEKLTPAATMPEIRRIDFHFHRVLNALVGSERFRQVFDSIGPHVQQVLSASQRVGDYRFITHIHVRIFEELASGDPERAGAAIREHLDIARTEALHTVALENPTEGVKS